MYSMLQEIDKYIKENDIPFRAISVSKCYFPNYINMAITSEIKKSVGKYFTKPLSDYELRYDKNDVLYMLVRNETFRENFVITSNTHRIIDDYKCTGKSEKHIIKWGCLFKLLANEINNIREKVNQNCMDLCDRERLILEYKLIDDLLEKKYREMVDDDKYILNIVDYEEDLIESTYKLKDYIRYLDNLYHDGVKVKRRI